MYRTPEVESLRIPQLYNRRLFARAAQFANAAGPLPTPPEAPRPCRAAVGGLFEPGFLQPWIVIVVDDAEAGRPTRTANVHPVPRHAAAGCPSHDNSRGTLREFDDELDAVLTRYFITIVRKNGDFLLLVVAPVSSNWAPGPALFAHPLRFLHAQISSHARRSAQPRCHAVGRGSVAKQRAKIIRADYGEMHERADRGVLAGPRPRRLGDQVVEASASAPCCCSASAERVSSRRGVRSSWLIRAVTGASAGSGCVRSSLHRSKYAMASSSRSSTVGSASLTSRPPALATPSRRREGGKRPSGDVWQPSTRCG